MKKTVAFIGVKNPLASALAGELAEANYRVLLIDQDSNASAQLSALILSKNANVNIEAVACAHEGSWEADVIIIPSADLPLETIASTIKEVVTGKVLITFSGERNVAEQLQTLLPYTKIVNTYIKNYMEDFEEKNSKEIKVLISGNDFSAVDTASLLMKDLGFLPVKIGLPY